MSLKLWTFRLDLDFCRYQTDPGHRHRAASANPLSIFVWRWEIARRYRRTSSDPLSAHLLSEPVYRIGISQGATAGLFAIEHLMTHTYIVLTGQVASGRKAPGLEQTGLGAFSDVTERPEAVAEAPCGWSAPTERCSQRPFDCWKMRDLLQRYGAKLLTLMVTAGLRSAL